MEEKDNRKKNVGCFILLGIFALANTVYFVLTTSKSEISNTGVFFAFITLFAIAYFVIRIYLRNTENIDNKFIRIVVPILIGIVFILLFSAIVDNFKSMYILGIIGFIVFCIVIGILINNAHNR